MPNGNETSRSSPDCREPGREYARATREHVRLLKQGQTAVRDGDSVKVRELEQRIAQAEGERIAVRDRLTRHDRASHTSAEA